MVHRIGVFSDSHGKRWALENAIDAAGKLDAAVFLGDGAADAVTFVDKLGFPAHCVRGNNDLFCDCASELTLDLYGVRVFCTHGHYYNVHRDNYRLVCRARESGASVVLFGHTHVSQLDYDSGLLLVNPGSVGEPRDGKGTSFAVLEIENGCANAKIFKV